MNSFISYHENISIGRSLNHFLISISYIKMLYKLKKPDIIICSYPYNFIKPNIGYLW